jgi:hypothetical protein
MKKLSVKLVAVVGLVGLVVGLAGCCSIFKSCLPPPSILILGQPQSELVLSNGEADFSVNAVLGPSFTTTGLTYQWQVNKVLLDSISTNANWTNCTCPGATTSSITISNVQLSDVGYYRVLVSAPGASIVTSAAPYLQEITVGSTIVNGTPIASSSGAGNYCSGLSYTGYIPYTNNPGAGAWGFAVVKQISSIGAADAGPASGGGAGVPTPGTQVGYFGYNGDPGCGGPPPQGKGGSVSKPADTFSPPNGSSRYQFTLYFPGGVPTGTYTLSLTNLQQ